MDAAKICDAGNALLYSSSSTCGDATFRKIGSGVLSEVLVQKDNIIVGISGEASKDSDLKSKDNLVSLKSKSKKTDDKIIIDGWRQLD